MKGNKPHQLETGRVASFCNQFRRFDSRCRIRTDMGQHQRSQHRAGTDRTLTAACLSSRLFLTHIGCPMVQTPMMKYVCAIHIGRNVLMKLGIANNKKNPAGYKRLLILFESIEDSDPHRRKFHPHSLWRSIATFENYNRNLFQNHLFSKYA